MRSLGLFAFVVSTFCAGAAVQAACTGQDLFAAMPEARQNAMREAAHAAPHAQGLLFRATRGDETVTLLGTYHLPDPRHEPLLAEVRPALDTAAAVLVEAGPVEEEALQAEMVRNPMLMFSDGPTLPEVLPEELWQEVMALGSSRGVPSVLLAKMRPAFLATTLAMPPCATAEIAAGKLGLDKQLIAEAEARNVPVQALEPFDTIFRIFDQIPDSETVDLLRSAVIGAEQADATAVTMGELYFAREPRLIWEFSRELSLQGGMSAETIARQLEMSERLLITQRNQNWVPVIEEALAKGPVIAAVGAMHLSGEHGVLHLLEERGFTVERLD
ncbi:TraB/GumN family protein [Sedimentimonas flavescens]|uniref:TraB/GumN family protein n=1 Tax=Sedimentimonas flavescens TaxID=2851012 RepID=A0ABT2ZYS7_9RHOB|nr:TraB/GumN family protein [Sedimentimonas flavescens]MBW0157680.1 TraB/GumN family protein [Sedimentimonas flavescens]MCV2878811.1 TraB/GumN family protein [Sedimentimonas flavescens]